MTVKQICELPVKQISADDSYLFMWWLASMPEEALAVVRAWGFELKTMTCFSWIKQTSTGKDHFGMGFYTRQAQEHCLIARRGKPMVIAHNVRQNIRAVTRKHSAKPPETRERILQLCGDLPRVELFAREVVDGWDSWGNEIVPSNLNLYLHLSQRR